MATTPESNPTPPYLPFKTFDNFVTELGEGALPARIDKSILGKKSGSVQAWLPGTLKFFGLIDDRNVPTKALEALVKASGEQRKTAYAKLVKDKYAGLFNALDISNATQEQFNEWLKEFGIKGSTVNKCAAFFIDLAKAGDVTISPYFKKESAPWKPSNGTKRKKATERTQDDDERDDDRRDRDPQPDFNIPALEDKLIVGLMERLPAPGESFEARDRQLWMELAAITFRMVYGDTEAGR